MNTRNAIVELLRAGHSDRAISRQVQVRNGRVGEIRRQYGIAPHQPGPARADSPEGHFWRHAEPVDGGHLVWPYAGLSFRVGHEGRRQSVRRVAFTIRHGREPEGQVKPGCDRARCVHPDHMEDQPMRQRYAAIFGEVAV